MKLVPQVVHMPWATPLVLSIVITYYLSRLFEFSDKGGRQLQLVVFFEFSDKGGRQQQVVDVCIAVVTVVAKGGHGRPSLALTVLCIDGDGMIASRCRRRAEVVSI